MNRFRLTFISTVMGLVALTGACIGEEMIDCGSMPLVGGTNKLTWSVSAERLQKQSSWDPVRHEIPLPPHAAVSIALTWLQQQGVVTNNLTVVGINMAGRMSQREGQWYYQVSFEDLTGLRAHRLWWDRHQVIVLLDGTVVEPQLVGLSPDCYFVGSQLSWLAQSFLGLACSHAFMALRCGQSPWYLAEHTPPFSAD